MSMQTRREILMLASLAAIAAPASALAQTQLAERRDGVASYLARMLALGHASLQASQLALERAADDDIVAFARLEVLEQETLASILGASDAAGDIDGSVPQPITDQFARISELEGAEFELAYLESQIGVHNELLEAGNVLADARELSLETVAAKIGSVTISSHLLTLNLLQQKLGAQRIDDLEAQGAVEEPAS